MKKYKIAAILMILHGGFIEIGGIFGGDTSIIYRN